MRLSSYVGTGEGGDREGGGKRMKNASILYQICVLARISRVLTEIFHKFQSWMENRR